MRCLVTGGAGFIGSWTAEALLELGHDVLVYDSFITGRLGYLGNVAHGVRVIRGDVRCPLELQRAVYHFRPHAVIHLAGCVSVPLSQRRALSSHDHNTRGTLVVLEAARARGVRRVVVASSAAVYGRHGDLPLREEAPLTPLSPYAVQKRLAEDYARLYSELYGIETVALRYFNIFGPRQDPASPYSGVISRFVEAARTGKSVSITGDGTQTRDFVFVGDVARVNVAALTADLAGHHVFNVGTGRETSLLELCAAIERVTARPLLRRFEPPRPGDVHRSCASVIALQRRLDVACTTPLFDGLNILLAPARAA